MSLSRTRMAPLLTSLMCGVLTFMHQVNFSAALAVRSPQPEVKIAGIITNRNGEAMNVKTTEGKSVEIVLNPDTKIEKPVGVVGFRKQRLDVTALTPGLGVVVKGLQYENDQLVAKTVTFSRPSLQSAKSGPSGSSAGPPVTDLADYSVKATYDAHFEAGSALLSETDKTGLKNLASSAAKLSTYIIQVQGFADVPGNNAYDQQLSRDRAEAVIDYLETTGSVPVTHILAPGVFRAQAAAATGEPAGGNPQNRRVEVKLLQKNASNH